MGKRKKNITCAPQWFESGCSSSSNTVMKDLFTHVSLKVEGVEIITLSSKLPFFTQVLLFISLCS